MASTTTGPTRQITYLSHGVPLLIRVGSEELLAALSDLLPHDTKLIDAAQEGAQTFSLLPPSVEHGYRCFQGEELALEHEDAKPVMEQFSRDVMVYVANHAPDRVFVHAGVVGWRGGALVFPGASFAGKSTLIAALLCCGATYYSDEYAVLDSNGLVYPYARALQMRSPDSRQQHGVDCSHFGSVAGIEPLRVTHVIFATYTEASRWNPQPVSSGMAVLEMLRHAIPVQRTPARVMSALRNMMSSAKAWRSQRGEASEAARDILSAINEETTLP